MTARPLRRPALVALAAALWLTGCSGLDSGSDTGSDPGIDAGTDGSAVVSPSAASTEPGLTWSTDEFGNVNAVGRYFAADSPWNQRVDTARVDADSARLLTLASERVGVVEQPGNLPPRLERRLVDDGLFVNTTRWTVPVVAGGVETPVICRQVACGDEIPGGTLPVPAGVHPDPAYDGWLTVIADDVAYDLWRARRESDGTISYHFVRAWQLDGQGFNAPQTVSARGSGLPLFAGLISRAGLESGRIEHALAISVPGPAQRSFVAPASASDGNGRRKSLPIGARIRLRADATWQPPLDADGEPITMTAQQQRVADALVAALRSYGAIVVERAAVPTLYAQRDVATDLLTGNELQGLGLDDFEVVELPERHSFPPQSVSPAQSEASSEPVPSSTASAQVRR